VWRQQGRLPPATGAEGLWLLHAPFFVGRSIAAMGLGNSWRLWRARPLIPMRRTGSRVMGNGPSRKRSGSSGPTEWLG